VHDRATAQRTAVQLKSGGRRLLRKVISSKIGAGAQRIDESGAPSARIPGRGFERLLDRHVFNDVEQCSTTALFTARADGRSASPAPLDFCKACLWQVIDASIDLRDPNPN